jgi:hypothetical protein
MASRIPVDIQFIYELIGDPGKSIKPKWDFKKAERLFKQLEFEIQTKVLADDDTFMKNFHKAILKYGVKKLEQ